MGILCLTFVDAVVKCTDMNFLLLSERVLAEAAASCFMKSTNEKLTPVGGISLSPCKNNVMHTQPKSHMIASSWQLVVCFFLVAVHRMAEEIHSLIARLL